MKTAVVESLQRSSVPFAAAADLCELAARKDLLLQRFADSANPVIIACYERSVRWLFHAAGVKLPENTTIN